MSQRDHFSQSDAFGQFELSVRRLHVEKSQGKHIQTGYHFQSKVISVINEIPDRSVLISVSHDSDAGGLNSRNGREVLLFGEIEDISKGRALERIFPYATCPAPATSECRFIKELAFFIFITILLNNNIQIVTMR